jgi:hypothetical protein
MLGFHQFFLGSKYLLLSKKILLLGKIRPTENSNCKLEFSILSFKLLVFISPSELSREKEEIFKNATHLKLSESF